MANEAQIESWDGPGGESWVAKADHYDRVNGPFNAHILKAVDPQPGERALDVGCGNGALTLDVAARVAPGGEVVGLDISGPMLSFATKRAVDAGRDNVRFVRGDAQVHDLGDGAAAFDVVVSRFGVMFFDDPTAAFANIARFLKPGARLAFTCWQGMLVNDWMMTPVGALLEHVPIPDLGPPGQPGPFAFAESEKVQTVLSSAGYTDVELEELKVPLLLGDDVDDTVSFLRSTEMATTLLGDVDAGTAERAWASVRQALEPHASGDGVRLGGAAWLVTATRR